LIELAKGRERVVQVGHIERFNAAVLELHKHLNDPRFIESHRLGPFTPRVKDVGVVKDLMIHDLDLILSLVQSPVTSVEAVGVSVLTPFEDIANGRLKFENGCIANLTASRVTPEQTRKIRFFQKDAYLSLDYQNHQLEIYRKKMSSDGTKVEIDREIRQMEKGNALQAELASFVEAIRTGKQPLVTGEDGLRALSLAEEISIQIHERF
jgi:predicted dehydrogenase